MSLLILLFSCATSYVPVDGPSWIFDPPSTSSSISFVGEGIGESEQGARAASYRNALERMGDDLGYEIISEYLREFLNTDRIEEIGAYVSSSYSTFDNSGYYYYILVTAPSEQFAAMRSEDIEEARARDAEIASLLASASVHYRSNEDVDALSDILDAVSLSLDGSLGHDPDALMDRALKYLGNIVLSVDGSDDAICTVTMKRSRGPFHPMVSSGKVDAAYKRVNNEGEIVEGSVWAATKDNGRFTFPWTDPYMVRDGEIRFSVDLPDDTIAQIGEKAGKEFLEPLLSLRDEKSIAYHYRLPDRFPDDLSLIAIVPYMRGENAVYPEETLQAFASQMDAAGVGYDIVLTAGEDENDIIRRLTAMYPDKRYFIISYLGITDYRKAFDGYYVRVDGRNLVMDRYSMLAEEEIFAASGGATMAEAERSALERGARIAAGMLLKEI